MKLTFEKVKEKLLSVGFTLIEDQKEEGVNILGTFGLNHCSCCKRSDGTISIFNDEKFSELWIQGATDGSSWNDPLTRGTLRWTLRELGIKSKDC